MVRSGRRLLSGQVRRFCSLPASEQSCSVDLPFSRQRLYLHMSVIDFIVNLARHLLSFACSGSLQSQTLLPERRRPFARLKIPNNSNHGNHQPYHCWPPPPPDLPHTTVTPRTPSAAPVPPHASRNAPARHPRHRAAPLRVAARVRRLVADARDERLAEQAPRGRLRHGRRREGLSRRRPPRPAGQYSRHKYGHLVEWKGPAAGDSPLPGRLPERIYLGAFGEGAVCVALFLVPFLFFVQSSSC